ncbi:DEAD/DEAH box helicase [soil metagenome]
MTSLTLHAVWCEGALHLWGEHAGNAEPRATGGAALGGDAATPAHAHAAGHGELRAALQRRVDGAALAGSGATTITLALPAHVTAAGASAVASHALAGLSGGGQTETDDAPATLATFRVPALRIGAAHTLDLLAAVDSEDAESEAFARSEDVAYFALLGLYCRWLLAQQRVVPMAMQEQTGHLAGLWQVWPADDASAGRLRILIAAMPPSARAAVDALDHRPWPIAEDFLLRTADAQCRVALARETMIDTIEGRDAAADPHVSWLSGLLSENARLECPADQRPDLLKRARGWIGLLQERGPSSAWRLLLRLAEPIDLGGLHDLEAPGPKLVWNLSLHLQSIEDPSLTLDAQEVWLLPADSALVDTQRIDKPQELLLSELARAARMYKPFEAVLNEREPTHLNLSTIQAYEFLREVKPLLIEQGYGVQAPAWWDSPTSRLGVRLKIDSPGSDPALPAPGSGSVTPPTLGLSTLVAYHWHVSLGDASLSLVEFEKLAAIRSPLVMIGGKWVEVRPEDIQAAIAFIRENPGGEMELGRAIRLAYAADMKQTGVPVVGMDVSGWAAAIFGEGNQQLPMLTAPEGFVGSLRPYQLKGLSWLAFLDRFGLGTCLADDMGLGKTIQFLAMLLREKAEGRAFAAGVANPDGPGPLGPTLLVVPMSVASNWKREAQRFAPDLKVLVHHGLERQRDQRLVESALAADLVVTTYALAYRDRAVLETIPWRRIALDEAQNIKNPQAKQTQAIRALKAPRRVALTGTPIENRLSELWSIMDFLNPGLLGTLHDFRTRFALPIERYHDTHKARKLRALVQPFVLRRLKTDPNVIADLPEKVETKDFCYLTPEQATLYETCVKSMLSTAEQSEGIQRRGIILAGLVKLKQICNHPQLFLKNRDDALRLEDTLISPARSGKCVRLIEMLDEVLSTGGQALVFTQFRQMGILLANMLRHELDRDVLLLHGGTTAAQRDQIVANFQRGDGTKPVLVLSLKAGGVGLNLTAANHVFHFDRWWNPAVETQATDRAYRIGQTRTVQVHKFVVAGTLEERIDQMIEQKTDLAANVIGSGETWLTELSLNQLRDVLMLREGAVEGGEGDGDGDAPPARGRDGGGKKRVVEASLPRPMPLTSAQALSAAAAAAADFALDAALISEAQDTSEGLA